MVNIQVQKLKSLCLCVIGLKLHSFSRFEVDLSPYLWIEALYQAIGRGNIGIH